MLNVVCTISIMVALNAGGNSDIPVETKVDVEGNILSEGDLKYIVDFREGLKKYPKTINPQNYDKTLVDKSDCVKE